MQKDYDKMKKEEIEKQRGIYVNRLKKIFAILQDEDMIKKIPKKKRYWLLYQKKEVFLEIKRMDAYL